MTFRIIQTVVMLLTRSRWSESTLVEQLILHNWQTIEPFVQIILKIFNINNELK